MKNRRTSHNNIEERVGKFKQEVSDNQGKIILVYREFITGKPRGHYEGVPTDKYIETGIISGGLKENPGFEVEFKTICLSMPLSDSRTRNTYTYFSNLNIPVENKLASHYLPFSIDDLRNIKRGEISIENSELIEQSGWKNVGKEPPYLTSFGAFIGDKNIKDFLKGGGIDYSFIGFNKGSIDDYFKLMKGPGEIQRRINNYDHKERGGLAEKLVSNVAKLWEINNSIKNLEDGVLKATCYESRDIDEKYLDWGIYSENINNYKNLREQANSFLERVDDLLIKAMEIKLYKLEFIGAGQLGFPQNMSTKEYIKFLTQEVPIIKSRIAKLDNHLSEQRKKAER